jgi:hypothetical protein
VRHALSLLVLGLGVAVGASAAPAQGPEARDGAQRQGGPAPVYRTPHLRFDSVHRHDRYYPVTGYVVPALPPGSLSVRFDGGTYFFHAGVWFRPSGTRFVVVLPPIGIVVPLLPPGYVSLWVGSSLYYYANGVYYAPDGVAGYVVVAPPVQAEVPGSVAPAALPEPIFYPRNGQSAAQTATDRRECDEWAVTQPGAEDPSVARRALGACMDARGYTMR